MRDGGEQMRLGVVIVNYFSSTHVVKLVESIRLVGGRASSIGIVVVDNSDDPDEFKLLRAGLETYKDDFGLVRTVASPVNLGYAGGNNVGIRLLLELGFSGIMVSNPDLVFRKLDVDGVLAGVNSRTPVVMAFETQDEGMVTNGLGAISRLSGRSRPVAAGGRLPGNRWIVYPGGHCLAASSSTWQALEGFSEDFFLFDEEPDLAIRLGELGGYFITSSSAVVEHDRGAISGSSGGLRRKSATTLYHSTRSSVILFRKHAKLWPATATVVTARIAYSFVQFIVGGKERALPVLKGLVAGLVWRRNGRGRSVVLGDEG